MDSNNSNSFVSSYDELPGYEGPFVNTSATTHEEDVLIDLRECEQNPLQEWDSTDDDRAAEFLSPDETLPGGDR